MKIEKSEMENKFILLYRLRCRWKLKSYKKKVWQQKETFLASILFKKVREEKGGGGYPSVTAYSRNFEFLLNYFYNTKRPPYK